MFSEFLNLLELLLSELFTQELLAESSGKNSGRTDKGIEEGPLFILELYGDQF